MYTINPMILFKLHLYLSYTKNITITNIFVKEYPQSFETSLQNNKSFTEPSAHVLLGPESLKYQDNNTTHRLSQKITPSVK